jgi:hypothetical protein
MISLMYCTSKTFVGQGEGPIHLVAIGYAKLIC